MPCECEVMFLNFRSLAALPNPTQNIFIKIDFGVGCRIVYLHLVALYLSVNQDFTICYKWANSIELILSSNQWNFILLKSR